MRVSISFLVLLFLIPAAPPAWERVKLDFAEKKLPKGWHLSSKAWKVKDHELHGRGEGYIEYRHLVKDDFIISFEAWTEEKANIELQLRDAKGREVYLIFAFLGKYHPVLDGVKCALLKGNRFVSVNPRQWIFPGRYFRFEVRGANNQYQMFLNGELGPVFTDPEPLEDPEYRIRIIYSPEGKQDELRLDDIELQMKK